MEIETTISLRSANPLTGVDLTELDKGLIRNVSIISAGDAKGHGFQIDETMLSQVASQIGAGVTMRFGHPIQTTPFGVQSKESLGTNIGRVINARLDGQRVRGDIQFGAYAKSVPGLGDVQTYLAALAKEDPTAFGLSAVFVPDVSQKEDQPMRSKRVLAVDVVGDPAANPAGLLSARTPCEQPARRRLKVNVRVNPVAV